MSASSHEGVCPRVAGSELAASIPRDCKDSESSRCRPSGDSSPPPTTRSNPTPTWPARLWHHNTRPAPGSGDDASANGAVDYPEVEGHGLAGSPDAGVAGRLCPRWLELAVIVIDLLRSIKVERPTNLERCDARTHRTGRFVMLAVSPVKRRRGGVLPLNIRDCADPHLRTKAGRGLPNSRADGELRDHDSIVGFPGSAGSDESQAGVRLSLWWAPLDCATSALRGLAACLSSEERRRADQLHSPFDRGRFLAARGWLRHLLASQLGCAPGEIRIVAGDLGKPRLACSELSFSAARTAGIALYATSWTMEVGVDIEAIRAVAEIDGIATRFMSPAEQRALMCLPPEKRLEAFFQCWTRKEAFGKGIGTGLSFPLRDLDVWDSGGRSITVFGWSVHQVDVAPGLAAAVAGASLGDWVPQVPRRLDALSLVPFILPPPGCSPRGLAAPGG